MVQPEPGPFADSETEDIVSQSVRSWNLPPEPHRSKGPVRRQCNEDNERFMRRVVGNMGKIQGVNLDKVRQSSFIKNSANFSSTEF